MIRDFFCIILVFHLFIFDTPTYPIYFLPKVIEQYTLKIFRKFSNTYCNSAKFGISKDGDLKFAIGETNKEFLSNKLNIFIDYQLFYKNILLSLEKNCQIFDFPEDELKNLSFQ